MNIYHHVRLHTNPRSYSYVSTLLAILRRRDLYHCNRHAIPNPMHPLSVILNKLIVISFSIGRGTWQHFQQLLHDIYPSTQPTTSLIGRLCSSWSDALNRHGFKAKYQSFAHELISVRGYTAQIKRRLDHSDRNLILNHQIFNTPL